VHYPYSLHSAVRDGQSGGTDMTRNTRTIEGHSPIFVYVGIKGRLPVEKFAVDIQLTECSSCAMERHK